jgi:hypothetical protein
MAVTTSSRSTTRRTTHGTPMSASTGSMGSLRARSTCHAPEKFARRAAFEFAGDGDKGGDDDGIVLTCKITGQLRSGVGADHGFEAGLNVGDAKGSGDSLNLGVRVSSALGLGIYEV